MPASIPQLFPRTLKYVRGRSRTLDEVIDKMTTQKEVDVASSTSNSASTPMQESRNPITNVDKEEAPSDATPKNYLSTTPTINNEQYPRALKILFLSSDTGGGHRASAQSLAQQFQRLFPGSTYNLCDIVQLDGPPPYNTLVRVYKHLSAHPQQWKLVYNVSNTRAYEMLADVHMKSLMERAVRKRILSYAPDVVVSVHPLMTNVPVLACSNITKETGRHLPIFTVCTDLGSAHSMWFANGVEKLFVASEMIKEIAMQRGKVPPEKIVISGLPIRHDFAVQAEKLGERHANEGKVYQRFVREQLGLGEYGGRKTVLVMGGGEGCGRLSHIVDSLYLQFVERKMEALILVVCGRNEKLKDALTKRDWDSMKKRYLLARNKGADEESCVGILSDAGCIDGGLGMANHLRRIISSPSIGSVANVPATPFSPASAKTHEANTHHEYATSLPSSRSNSRSGSPLHAHSDDTGDESIEVITETLATQKGDEWDVSMGGNAVEGSHSQSTTETVQAISPSPVAEYSGVASEKLPSNCGLKKKGVVPQVKVIGLGFITKMADYMVAADVLVTKAGPGTIAEAAALSLPVMLTSFLPGQEEGNVDYVVEGGFGNYVSDADPHGISEEVALWLLDEQKLMELSANAKKQGAPDAAAEIVDAIGESALRWKKINEESHKVEDMRVDDNSSGEFEVETVSSQEKERL